jgi:hypothetical protein
MKPWGIFQRLRLAQKQNKLDKPRSGHEKLKTDNAYYLHGEPAGQWSKDNNETANTAAATSEVAGLRKQLQQALARELEMSAQFADAKEAGRKRAELLEKWWNAEYEKVQTNAAVKAAERRDEKLQDELAALRSQKHILSLKNELAAKKKDSVRQAEVLRVTEGQLSELQSENANLQTQMVESRTDLLLIRGERDRLQTTVHSMKRERERLLGQLRTEHAEMAESKRIYRLRTEDLRLIRVERDRLQTTIQSIERERERLLEQLRTKHAEIAESKRCRLGTEDLRLIRVERDRLRSEGGRLQTTIRSVKHKHELLRGEHEHLKASLVRMVAAWDERIRSDRRTWTSFVALDFRDWASRWLGLGKYCFTPNLCSEDFQGNGAN